MTLSEFQSILESTQLPVAYRCFTEDEITKQNIKLPFIVWVNDSDNNFSADNAVHFSSHNIRVELYEKYRDATTETKVENALANFYYKKDIVYIDTEKCFEVIYNLNI